MKKPGTMAGLLGEEGRATLFWPSGSPFRQHCAHEKINGTPEQNDRDWPRREFSEAVFKTG